jgi:hypothetical protein
MKKTNIVVAISLVLFVFTFGCRKETSNDSSNNLPSTNNVQSLRTAYNSSSIANDSLISCWRDSAYMTEHDSIEQWMTTIHYNDGCYHHNDSMFNHYYTLCQQQVNMMGSGMMNNSNSNYQDYMHYMDDMNTLRNLHLQYHPHF